MFKHSLQVGVARQVATATQHYSRKVVLRVNSPIGKQSHRQLEIIMPFDIFIIILKTNLML